jgi:hypothetical protein
MLTIAQAKKNEAVKVDVKEIKKIDEESDESVDLDD